MVVSAFAKLGIFLVRLLQFRLLPFRLLQFYLMMFRLLNFSSQNFNLNMTDKQLLLDYRMMTSIKT